MYDAFVNPRAFDGVHWVLVILGGLVQLAIMAALVRWGRWVAARRTGRWWHAASLLPVLSFVFWWAGIGGTVIGLVHAFDVVATLPAQEKSLALSDGISSAMMWTAVLCPAAFVTIVAALIVFAIGTRANPEQPTLQEP